MPDVVTMESPNRAADSVSLRDLLTPLFRHQRLLLASFLLIFLTSLAFLLTRGKQYESHLDVLVNRERVDPLVSAEATSATGAATAPVSEEEINSEAELIHSQDLLARVVRENHLEGTVGSNGGFLSKLFRPATLSEPVRVDLAVESLAIALKVKSIPKSNVIEVSYASPNPRQTYGVLNSLANLYIAKHIAIQRPPGAYEYFARETQRYQDALNAAEEKLRQFGDDGRLAAPDLQRTALATQLANAIGQSHVDSQQIAGDIRRSESDTQRLQTTTKRIETARTVSPPTMLIQQLGTEMLKAKIKSTELAAKYNADYPLMREANEELRVATAAYGEAQKAEYVIETTDNDPTHEFLRQDLARAQADLAAQTGSLVAAQGSIKNLRSEMQDLDAAVLQQGDLMREVKASEQNFLLFQSKREQERASDTLDQIRIGNVSIAVPPAIPAIPVAARFPGWLLAFAIAALASIALTYIVAFLNPAVHSADELSDLLAVPVIVTIPRKKPGLAA